VTGDDAAGSETLSGAVLSKPSSSAERMRRLRERRRQEAAAVRVQPYRYAPFEPGNMAAVRSGAYSERALGPLAEEILAAHREDPAWPVYLSDPSYGSALRAWSRAEAAVELFSAFVSEQPPEEWIAETTTTEEQITGDGDRGGSSSRSGRSRKVGGSLEQWRKLEAHAATLRSRLGLDPLSRARLGKDAAAGQADMAKLMAQLAAEESAGRQQ
jgi:hypothetical protein